MFLDGCQLHSTSIHRITLLHYHMQYIPCHLQSDEIRDVTESGNLVLKLQITITGIGIEGPKHTHKNPLLCFAQAN